MRNFPEYPSILSPPVKWLGVDKGGEYINFFNPLLCWIIKLHKCLIYTIRGIYLMCVNSILWNCQILALLYSVYNHIVEENSFTSWIMSSLDCWEESFRWPTHSVIVLLFPCLIPGFFQFPYALSSKRSTNLLNKMKNFEKQNITIIFVAFEKVTSLFDLKSTSRHLMTLYRMSATWQTTLSFRKDYLTCRNSRVRVE